ncbi:hypothetical protein HG536_0G04250 [Torulaspora globosa]|uniref:Protein IBD2 n=1 Tax=Torulaspora globosa TaxID=48254 RepID=A0A7G3ZM27_9SACH|nr:uncharacterized protein HG536_0G04250 [Torulaspora globosa]QLL34563.1 hypothetical protein HG536_0G04250 [Torulaspora globosa]
MLVVIARKLVNRGGRTSDLCNYWHSTLPLLGMSSPAINQNGSLPVNMMMQEGMQALSKILKGPLLEQKRVNMDQATMQVLLGQGQNRKGREAAQHGVHDLNYDQYGIDDTVPTNQIVVETNHDEGIDDPELHLGDEEGEIIFDCGTQELVGSPDKIGEHITQMLESVLPNGIQSGADGRLHAVVNGDELNITEESFMDFKEAMSSLGQVQKLQRHQKEPKPSAERSAVEKSSDGAHEPYQGQEMALSDENHHQKLENSNRRNPVGHLEYDYPTTQPRKAPNFTALMSVKKPLCLFCEYYMVFGEPPRNMIKWYNNNYEYDDLPRTEEKLQHKNRRKRNR